MYYVLYELFINSVNVLEEYYICCNFYRCGCKLLVRYFIYLVLVWEDFLFIVVLISLIIIVKGNKDVVLKVKMIFDYKIYFDFYI